MSHQGSIIQPHYFLPIRSGEGRGSDRFSLLGSKITVDVDCSHEIRRFLLGRKAMTNLDSVLKSRDSTDKGLYNQGYGIPVVTYGCESLTVKKAECQRIDAFQLWCWRRLLRVLWTARRSNQSSKPTLNTHWKD